MPNWFAIAVAVMMFADADVPRVYNLRQPAQPAAPVTFGEEIPLFPTNPKSDADQTPPQNPVHKSATLQEESKLALIRFVSGEFAKASKSLPAGKEGFLVYADKPLNTQQLDHTVATHGAAVHVGDNVQITKLDFKDHVIIVDVNGGGRGKKRFLDHLQIGMGGTPVPTSTVASENQGPPGLQPGMGSTIFLEFNKPIPDLTPEELKQLLSPLLDFSKQRSASVQWFDTLPPDIKKAIQDRRPLIGMDREMVVAAIGKPGHKVRERDNDGNEIEDWIYGTPPAKTIFVRFTGDRVSSIKQFPN
ncbi:MAG TPA: hypothetical protein VNX66_04290 [Candidatus Sulfotelmatobacter sp.]|jgi:hypothetical protein|nr:hypothetical protein [Candidatus Sulfotelmatobacter sp.]